MAERTYKLLVLVLVPGKDGHPGRMVMRRFAGGLSWQEARVKRQAVYEAADRRHRRRPTIQIAPERRSGDAGDGGRVG